MSAVTTKSGIVSNGELNFVVKVMIIINQIIIFPPLDDWSLPANTGV